MVDASILGLGHLESDFEYTKTTIIGICVAFGGALSTGATRIYIGKNAANLDP